MVNSFLRFHSDTDTGVDIYYLLGRTVQRDLALADSLVPSLLGWAKARSLAWFLNFPIG